MQVDAPRFDKNMDNHSRFARLWDNPQIEANLNREKED